MTNNSESVTSSSGTTQTVLDRIESNIEKHLSEHLEEKISKSIETRLTHSLLKDEKPKMSQIAELTKIKANLESNSSSDADKKSAADQGDTEPVSIAPN